MYGNRLLNRCTTCMSPVRFSRVLWPERTAPLCMEAVHRMSKARNCTAAASLLTSLHNTRHAP